MSKQRISDSFLGNLINRSVGAALSDVIPLARDLIDARAEIARLIAERDGTRAEALEEAAKIADAEAADADRQIAENDAYCERIGRRSSFASDSANASCRSRRIHARFLAEKIRSAAKTETSR